MMCWRAGLHMPPNSFLFSGGLSLCANSNLYSFLFIHPNAIITACTFDDHVSH